MVAILLAIEYFYLVVIYLFVDFCAVSSLLCGLFSSCGQLGLLSSSGAQASHCRGFSGCRAGALGHPGFSGCGSQDLEHRLNSCAWA